MAQPATAAITPPRMYQPVLLLPELEPPPPRLFGPGPPDPGPVGTQATRILGLQAPRPPPCPGPSMIWARPSRTPVAVANATASSTRKSVALDIARRTPQPATIPRSRSCTVLVTRPPIPGNRSDVYPWRKCVVR